MYFKRFSNLFINLGYQLDNLEVIFNLLIKKYSQKDRFYHNFKHIEDSLEIFDKFSYLAESPLELECAIWFHDIIYDTKIHNNEEESAKFISSILEKGKVNSQIIDKVYKLIIATQHNINLFSNDENLIVDIDLAILGKSEEIFNLYNKAIRKEYFWVPEDIYLKERKKVLISFYDRESIYYHKEIADLFEKRAKKNLESII